MTPQFWKIATYRDPLYWKLSRARIIKDRFMTLSIIFGLLWILTRYGYFGFVLTLTMSGVILSHLACISMEASIRNRIITDLQMRGLKSVKRFHGELYTAIHNGDEVVVVLDDKSWPLEAWVHPT